MRRSIVRRKVKSQDSVCVADIAEYLEAARQSGVYTSATQRNHEVALRAVLEIIGDSSARELPSDRERLLAMFLRLAEGRPWSTATMVEYARRLSQLVDVVRAKRNNSHAQAVPVLRGRLVRAFGKCFRATFPLRSGVDIELLLPRDLRRDEADRLCRFIIAHVDPSK